MTEPIYVKRLVAAAVLAALALGFVECAEEGAEGDAGIDCGEHGTEHEGHCHCDDGYLYDGETCVAPDQITEECAEGMEGEHAACVCPDEGNCPCANGEIVTIEGNDYCVPDPDAV